MKDCKECKTFKKLTDFYKHPLTLDGFMGRCKECIKEGRKSERERKMARINDKKRSKTRERLEYLKIRCKEFRKKNPLKYKAHQIVNNYFRSSKIKKPDKCSNCNMKDYIVLHHEDYNKPREVIPLCQKCHIQYHEGKIKINLTKNIFLN